jgi:hypothetical protein
MDSQLRGILNMADKTVSLHNKITCDGINFMAGQALIEFTRSSKRGIRWIRDNSIDKEMVPVWNCLVLYRELIRVFMAEAAILFNHIVEETINSSYILVCW